jgi:hypothetical protein
MTSSNEYEYDRLSIDQKAVLLLYRPSTPPEVLGIAAAAWPGIIV